MKKNQSEITFLEGLKVFIVTAVSISAFSLLIGFITKLVFNCSLLIGSGIGLISTILIIFLTGAWKPATENENTCDNDEDDD